MEEAFVRPNVRGALSALDFKIEVPENKQTKGLKMAKELFHLPLGPMGEVELKVEDGKVILAGHYEDDGYVKLEAGYELAKLLEPVKTNFVDKLKSLIPGDIDDKIIDAAWDHLIASVSESA